MTEPSAGLEQEETEHDVDLIHECVVKMAKEISDFMDIAPDKQRMDSLMVAANIRNLSLLELFYTCVANLCKIMDERGTKIPDEQYHYGRTVHKLLFPESHLPAELLSLFLHPASVKRSLLSHVHF